MTAAAGGEPFVEPAYGGRSLADVVPAIAGALGVPWEAPSGLVLPEAPSYVLFLIDGLGARLLERYSHAAPYLSSLLTADSMGTAGVPSTTATSLTSLGTALPPGVHGLVGYTARIPGTDRLINHLSWDKSVDPLEWQPHPTAFARLAGEGVHVTSINKREFSGSGLTLASQRGAHYVGADRVGERIAAALAGVAHGPALAYVYDSDLDWTGHRFGVASTQWLQQLSMVDAQAEQLRETLPAHTRLVIVADHGMVDAEPEDKIDVDEVVGMRDGVALLGGEARFRHVYCAAGAVEDVVATWRETLGARADVMSREEAIARGWFGPVESAVRPRIGDVVAAAKGNAAVVSSVDFKYEMSLVGLHGSLTPAEMLIPILIG